MLNGTILGLEGDETETEDKEAEETDILFSLLLKMLKRSPDKGFNVGDPGFICCCCCCCCCGGLGFICWRSWKENFAGRFCGDASNIENDSCLLGENPMSSETEKFSGFILGVCGDLKTNSLWDENKFCLGLLGGGGRGRDWGREGREDSSSPPLELPFSLLLGGTSTTMEPSLLLLLLLSLRVE